MEGQENVDLNTLNLKMDSFMKEVRDWRTAQNDLVKRQHETASHLFKATMALGVTRVASWMVPTPIVAIIVFLGSILGGFAAAHYGFAAVR